MVVWNVTMDNALEKRRIKVENMKMKIFNTLCKTTTSLQIIITKASILSDHENAVSICLFLFIWFLFG